jgi:hypothetical protein
MQKKNIEKNYGPLVRKKQRFLPKKIGETFLVYVRKFVAVPKLSLRKDLLT